MQISEIEKASIAELPQNLTRLEAARYLRKHVRSLDRMIARKELKAVKVGGSVLIPKSEIARLVSP